MSKLRIPISIVLILLCALRSVAQGDKWVGSWEMQYKPTGSANNITIQLQIGLPEYNALFPAQLKVDFGSFSGTYELLLAKKNDQQLGLGRTKYPVQEAPFKLGAWMLYLNGTLDFKNGGLSLQRMWIDQHELFMQGLYSDDAVYAQMKDYLRELLSKRPINFRKIDNTPWKSPDTRRILHPEGDTIYFGIYDKATVHDSIVPVMIRDANVEDRDTVSFLHNGKVLLDRQFVSGGGSLFQVPLDTGMNILTFFADNYGKLPPNTGSFRVKSDSGYLVYDFEDHSNLYATFLVAQIYRQPLSPKPQPQLDKRVTERRNSLVDQISVSAPDAVLELWDDAAEDGDSISIRLNDQLVVGGFPVLKQRQQLSVVLTPGENRLILLADNLGSIPPNTAVMKITAGKIKKYVRIKTDLKQNNLLLINYQPKE